LTCCSTLQISIYRSFLLADDRDSRELCSFLNWRPKSVYCIGYFFAKSLIH
jgi:hypothetical protein